MKIKKLLLGLLSILTLVSCRVEIPEGDIKEFVNVLSYDRALQHITTANSNIVVSHYEGENKVGQISTTKYIEITNDSKYFYVINEKSGNLITNENETIDCDKQEILCYYDKDYNITSYEIKDGINQNIKYNDHDVNSAVNSFFFTDVSGGYHQGGMYYGDYIYNNCGKYYNFFKLNEEKNRLTYEMNTEKYNDINERIIFMHKFTVDEYGMIVSLYSKSLNTTTRQAIVTQIDCKYNIDFEKLEKLEV